MRREIAATIALAVAACGGSSPIAPTGSVGAAGLPFTAGRYVFEITGDTLACGNQAVFAGTDVRVVVNIARSGSAWIGSTQGLTLTLDSGPRPPTAPTGIGISGSLRGAALDTPPVSNTDIPNGTTLSVDGAVPLAGTLPNTGGLFTIAFGTIDGAVTFSRNGVTVTCPRGAVSWSLGGTP